MGSWQSLIWVNVATLMGTVLPTPQQEKISPKISLLRIPLGFYAIVGTEEIKVPGSKVEMFSELTQKAQEKSLTEARQILSGLSTFTFGMTSQFMLVEAWCTMVAASKLNLLKAKISAPFQLVMFAVAGVGGYLFMGNKVGDTAWKHLDFLKITEPSIPFRTLAGCMLTHMLISYLIKGASAYTETSETVSRLSDEDQAFHDARQGVVLCKSVHRAIDRTYAHASDNRPRSWQLDSNWEGFGKDHAVLIISFMLALAWFLANIVPFFGAAVDLLGASVTPISCWLIPLVCYMRPLN
eukprot:Skav212151  [mRNA]  locus=scaffold754:48169:53503:+ [translate_table: standard]